MYFGYIIYIKLYIKFIYKIIIYYDDINKEMFNIDIKNERKRKYIQ